VQPYDPTQPYGTPQAPAANPVSGQPQSSPPSSGPPALSSPPPAYQPPGYQPPEPRPPTYQPGYAQPVYPQPEQPGPAPAYPATAPFPAYQGEQPGQPVAPGYPPGPGYPPPGPGYPPAGQGGYQAGPAYPAGPPGYNPAQPGYPGQPPNVTRRSNVPIVAVIVAVALLLCGGIAVAGVLIVRSITEKAQEAIDSIPTEPPKPNLPTEFPTGLPTDLPTDLPGLPGLPTDGTGRTITVVYEVTGSGTADISYVEKLGETPKQAKGVKLPWRKEVSMTGATLVLVTAYRSGSGSGLLGCTATVDGEEVAKRSAEGSYAVATCTKLIFN
jgi:hypothetical protein